MKNQENLDLHFIADENNLTYIETTSGSNGYPENIKPAIIGFKTFEEAEEIANQYGLEIQSFTKKDGWSLWSRTNNNAYEAMTISADADFGDNYSEFESMTEDDFIEQEIEPILKDTEFGTIEDIEEFIKSRKNLFEEIENLEDGQIVISYYGAYYETIDKKCMYFSHDTNHYAIGLIEPLI